MKLKLVWIFIFLMLFNCKQQHIPLYIGTYTDGESEGIYQLQFNTDNGLVSDLTLVAKIKSPSFIAYSPNKNYIYAIDEDEDGYVTSFKIESKGKLQFINRVKSFGGPPCHVSVNQSGTKVAASNYKGGNISLYDVNEDGSLHEASQVFNHNLDSITSHAHSAQFINNELFVADLGRNAMYLYEKKNETNYTLKDSSIVQLTQNAGPRHFTLTKNGEFLYVINEYASTITAAKRHGNNFEVINHFSTLSNNYQGFNSCADIHLSKDERFLYGSNRGENSIAVFKRDLKTGALEKVQNMSVHGDWPRNFNLDPSGKFLLVANRRSSNISIFSIDNPSGKLTYLHDVKVPNPSCLLF